MFPLIRSFGATGLLIEYEDMFPYHGKLKHLQAQNAYTPDDIAKLHSMADVNNLIIIPLVQTFGHFEASLRILTNFCNILGNTVYSNLGF